MLKKLSRLANNYIVARLTGKPSTAAFWYLPEPPTITTPHDLDHYRRTAVDKPLYLIDYRQKLKYQLKNDRGIILLPYDPPTGPQVNPEAAFQYALGLHDQYCHTADPQFLNQFTDIAHYFYNAQSAEGLWDYQFDWYGSKAPWHSALAQARGACVMVRAWLHTGDESFRKAAVNALSRFEVSTDSGGFLHCFGREDCPYFEEYPATPTGVLNGFMSSLISLWDVHFWLQDSRVLALWNLGIASLEKMLPHYTNGWWSLYDLDERSPVENVNSPRYHLLEIHYLQVLTVLSGSDILSTAAEKRMRQYRNYFFRIKATGMKLIRKVLYK